MGSGRVEFCLPILSTAWHGVEDAVSANREAYGYFEVWLDYLDDLRVEALEQLGSVLGGRLIVLFRRQRLEPIRMPAGERQRIMTWAAAAGCLVDIDLETQPEDLDYLSSLRGARAILSYHNYQETPARER